MPIITADLISLMLVIYVFVRLYENRSLKRDVKRRFVRIGWCLITSFAMDEIWELIYLYQQSNAQNALYLNATASLQAVLIPVILCNLIGFHKRHRDRGDRIAYAASCALILLDLLNIRFPIVFVHTTEFYMINTPFTIWIYLGTLALVCYILIHDFLFSFDVDRESVTMLVFVLIIAGLGLFACYASQDIVAVWECISIAYLFLYLTVSRLYDKTDPITGLPNRNTFTRDYFLTDPGQVTLVSFDLNHLKQYNDSFGHTSGDSYLRAFARSMKRRLGPYGKLYRTGGDEFCMISKDEEQELQDVITAIRRDGRCDPQYGDYPLDFAFGVAKRREGETTEELYNRSDAIMYRDKKDIEGKEEKQ